MPARKHPDAICEECPLFAKPCAPTQSPENPQAAVVSRSPGYHEALAGKPFSGPSGKILDHLLGENGLERKDVLVTNTVLCAPDAGKVPPEAIKACAPRLASELGGVPLIIAAGAEAVNLLCGRGSIDRYRGYRIQKGHKRIVVATNNPALVLRDDSTFPNLRKDFKRAFNPIPEPRLPKVVVIEDARDAAALLAETNGLVACDIESRGGLSHKATLVSLQLATQGDVAYVLGERQGLFTNDDFIRGSLRPFLESNDNHFIWHNGKFDVKVLRYGYGIQARVDEDTMLMAYALDERTGEAVGHIHALEYLLMEEFGWPDYEPDSVRDFKKSGIVGDYDALHEYAGRDVAGTFQLHDHFTGQLRTQELERPYRRLLIEGSEALARIELSGFRYRIEDAADVMENDVGPELKQKATILRGIIDNPLYKPRSTVQNSILYYDTWKVTHAMQKRPDKRRSCDEAALKEVVAGRFRTAPQHIDKRSTIIKFSKELLRFRSLAKQADTYIVGMIERAQDDPEGKVYTVLGLHTTTSGRLSSRNPNLQNITRTKPDLPDIRKLFYASPGRQIVQADYSQAELRTIAQLSQAPELVRIYKEGLDLHSIVAERFYGADFTSEQRVKAKNMNFGVGYLQGAGTFQEKHDIPEREAARFIKWWYTEYPEVREWQKEISTEMRTGEVVTPFGRKRRFYLLTPENLQECIRQAVNYKPQSIASDFTLRSVIVMCNEVDWAKASIVLTVHDNVVGDVEESYIDEYRTICQQVMESTPKDEVGWDIPYTVDIGVGPTWAEAK